MFIQKQLQKKITTYTYKKKQNLLNNKELKEFETLKIDLKLLLTNKLKLKNATSELSKNLLALRVSSENKINKFITTSKNKILDEIINILATNDKTACIVGGALRDILINFNPKDIDFVSSLNYNELRDLFAKFGFSIKENGKSFLVLMVSKKGFWCHIANFRKEGEYSDLRHPNKIQIATMPQDAKRRDFTINALYYNLANKSLFDSSGRGLFDLSKKQLVFTSSKVLAQDYIRAWRLVKFSYRGFNPSKKTLKLVRRGFDKIYKNSNPTRVLKELEEIFKPITKKNVIIHNI